MTLEDFFTLTEIKDGLTLTSRVEELMSVMHSNKDSVLKNNSDASRQWLAVASTIAATKNRECLDVFVNLDGLLYLGSWLAEAQMLANDSVDRSKEELIPALLEAIKNLGVDSSKLVSSGIWVAVKKLVDHGSSQIQDQARKLFGSWKDMDVGDQSERDTESCNTIRKDELTVVVASMERSGQKPCSMQSINEKRCPDIADEALPSGSSEENNPDHDKGLELQNDKARFDMKLNSQCVNKMTEPSNPSSTGDMMKAVQEKISVKEKSSTNEISGPTIFGTMPTGSSSLPYSDHDIVEGSSNTPLDAETSKEKQMTNSVCMHEKLGEAVVGSSSSAGQVAGSSEFIVASMELEKKCLLQSSLDSNGVSRNSETICGSHDVNVDQNSKQVSSLTHITDNQDLDNSSRLSGGHYRSRKVESDNTTTHAENEGRKDDKGHSDRKRRVKRRKKGSSSRSMTVSQRLGAIDKATTDIDLGILDALEVATKVAQEVAREVDSGESSHSSSEEVSEESEQSGGQDSGNDDLHTGSPSKGLLGGENYSSVDPRGGDDDVIMADRNDKHENAMMKSGDLGESHPASAAKPEVAREKSPCGFDLNQDICSDETDIAKSTNAIPMAVSNSGPIFGMPAAAPQQLEKSFSGEGSAASSVFQSALPHKVPRSDLREKQVCRGIDLNVAEVGDDQVEDLTPWKQFPFSSLNSRVGESSREANLWGSSKLNLDLNCMNEDEAMPPPSESNMETRLFLSHNGQQRASPASSSSVAQQSGKEVNFDLNDRPQFFIDSRDQGPYHGRHPWGTAPYGGHKMEEPGISILGTKVDADRKDSVSQMASFLSNGKSLEPAGGLYMGRTGNSMGLAPGVSFSPAPIYGYNGLSGPPGLSMSSTMYVPGTAIPYMVDSRGTPVMMPQIIGSSPYAQQPQFPQQHMFMNMAGGSLTMNGSVRPNFDQNPGFGLEMGNRESMSLRQFLPPSQSGAMGEHSGANLEPSSSSSISIGGKRKEPETRWEFPPWR